MKLTAWLETGQVISKEVHRWTLWGDGFQAMDENSNLIFQANKVQAFAEGDWEDVLTEWSEKKADVSNIYNEGGPVVEIVRNFPPIDAVSKHRIETE